MKKHLMLLSILAAILLLFTSCAIFEKPWPASDNAGTAAPAGVDVTNAPKNPEPDATDVAAPTPTPEGANPDYNG